VISDHKDPRVIPGPRVLPDLRVLLDLRVLPDLKENRGHKVSKDPLVLTELPGIMVPEHLPVLSVL